MIKKLSSGPRDVFLYLLHIILLYFSAINLGVLLYQFIDLFFPDAISGYYQGSTWYLGPLRWAVATLTIVFPVYLWSGWYLEKEYKSVPEKRDLWIRRWLLNFTLFATVLIIIGDFVAVLYRFLEGELTVRFILKVVTILLISSSVFIYYYWNLKNVTLFTSSRMRWFVRLVIGVVVLALISGFAAAGSPQQERLKKTDQQRVADLQNIQSQILYYWQQKGTLPGSLDELYDSISGYRPPVDPKSAANYEYRIVSELEFELCADFEAESGDGIADSQGRFKEIPPVPVRPGYDMFQENWNHDVGRMCFTRTIDPELYKKSTAFHLSFHFMYN